MSEPKNIVCALCHQEKIVFHHSHDRTPNLMKMYVTINTTMDEDVPGHCYEMEVPDDFSANTFITLFKMFLRAFKP